jgi:xanthine dehydrogenase accessory factor
MKEINSIIRAFLNNQEKKEKLFLATVVNVQGSTYRQPGARMLITSSGKIVGTISGGCLENDVVEHTRLMTDDQTKVITYDTNAEEDITWGFGLGCNGVVDILIERIYHDDPFNPLAFINQCLSDRKPGIIASVFNVSGNINISLGAHLTVNSDGLVNSNISEPVINNALKKDAVLALQSQSSSFHKYQFLSGEVNVFIEFIQPLPSLMIFGAGRDAVPVAEFAKALGWQVSIFDCRGLEVTKERFTMADEIILTRREILCQQLSINDYSVAVVMTHNYFDDLEVLKVLLPSDIKYLGCLGSRQRITKLLADVQEVIGEFKPEQLTKFYAPVGLDIGADTPESIALSMVAEIQAILKNRDGGFLKYRKESINQRNKIEEIAV